MMPITKDELSTLDMIADALSQPGKIVVGNAQFGETLRRVAFAVREYQRVSPAEERAAWSGFLAAAFEKYSGLIDAPAHFAATKERADRMLVMFRERFGGDR